MSTTDERRRKNLEFGMVEGRLLLPLLDCCIAVAPVYKNMYVYAYIEFLSSTQWANVHVFLDRDSYSDSDSDCDADFIYVHMFGCGCGMSQLGAAKWEFLICALLYSANLYMHICEFIFAAA